MRACAGDRHARTEWPCCTYQHQGDEEGACTPRVRAKGCFRSDCDRALCSRASVGCEYLYNGLAPDIVTSFLCLNGGSPVVALSQAVQQEGSGLGQDTAIKQAQARAVDGRPGDEACAQCEQIAAMQDVMEANLN
jgi:hypothetical protein